MEHVAFHLRITGKVQGVWYRGWTEDTARELGLTGWVRNRKDGSVEAVVAGPPDAVETMISRCHVGPPAAAVSAVDSKPAPLPDMVGFEQRSTV
jgi:acylphosphatase